MREDYLEQLEKMFPKGFLIVYTLEGTDQFTRIATYLPSDTQACRQIQGCLNLLNEANNE